MQVSYAVAPAELLWADDLFANVQAFKAGTFDSSGVYEQFAWLIVPEVEMHGAGGAFTGYFGIQAPDAQNNFSVLAPIIGVSVWMVEDHVPVYSMMQTFNMDLSFASVLAATSALDLERLIYRGDDTVLYLAGTGDSTADVLHGWNGNDDISVQHSVGGDRLFGNAGDDRISIFTDGIWGRHSGGFFGYGGAGQDTVLGDGGADRIFGGTGRDSLSGFAGNDLLSGGKGVDILSGGEGADTLAGDEGADVIAGNAGVDRLSGGEGADVFAFFFNGSLGRFDSGVSAAARDVVTDFGADDLIRLFDLTGATLDLIGHAAFSAANQVRWYSRDGSTIIQINVDAAPDAEMAITLQGFLHLGADDFYHV